jgi:N,N'-diacetyllegionaminate synthase
MGAKVIERHFTKDRTFKGSDHAASLELPGLKKLIRDIRIIENAKGHPVKVIEYSETECIKKLLKSIVSACVIKKDQIITKDMLTTKGPGTGISPMYIESIIGKRCIVDIECDKIITHEMLGL